MAFSSELSDFAEGFVTGQKLLSAAEERRYRRAYTDRLRHETERERPFTEADEGAIPDPLKAMVSLASCRCRGWPWSVWLERNTLTCRLP